MPCHSIVLHAGLHKTGTTSIQIALNGYDDGHTAYADLGEVNHSNILKTLFADDHMAAFWERLGYDRAGIARLVDVYRDRLEGQLGRDVERIIISGEDIAVLDEASLGRLKTFLEFHCSDIQVVVFVRNPVSMVPSLIQEHVKHADMSWAVQDGPYPYRISDRVERIVEVFGARNVRICRYEDAGTATGGDVVRYFGELLGLDATRLKSEFANISLCALSFKILGKFFQSGFVHNNGSTLDWVKYRFMLRLDRTLRQSDPAPLCHAAFASLINRDDFDRLNALIDPKYPVDSLAGQPAGNEAMLRYLDDIDYAQVDEALKRDLRDRGMPFNPASTTTELLALLFYQEIADVTSAPSLASLESARQELMVTQGQLQGLQAQFSAAQQQLQGADVKIESLVQQLQCTEQKIDDLAQQLGSANRQIAGITSTRTWRLHRWLADAVTSVRTMLSGQTGS